MPKGEHLTKAHQSAAGMRPRPGRGPSKKAVAAVMAVTGETLEEATLRLQRARADTEELDRAKRQLELDVAAGKLVSRERAVDLAQQAVLRVCAILDLIPERLRDALPTHLHQACDYLDDVIRHARQEVARGDG